METITLKIDGMSCNHCLTAVRTALDEVPGVNVEDVQLGSAKLTYDPRATSVGALVDAIADAGYAAEEVAA